jgi:hypothetical protein
LAQHVLTRLVDDLDGSEAVVTVSFSLDGRSYEIDLSEGNLAEFRAALDPFVSAARRASGRDGELRQTARQGETAQDSVPGRVVSSPGPAVLPEARAVASRTSAQPFVLNQEPVQPEAARPERKRAPLVANPFDPQARIG